MTIHTQAQALVTTKTTWSGGESVELAKCGDKTVYVQCNGKDSADLFLVYKNGCEPIRVKCGQLSPMTGWQFSLTRRAYEGWVERTGHKAKQIERLPIAQCCPELRAEWMENGGVY